MTLLMIKDFKETNHWASSGTFGSDRGTAGEERKVGFWTERMMEPKMGKKAVKFCVPDLTWTLYL